MYTGESRTLLTFLAARVFDLPVVAFVPASAAAWPGSGVFALLRVSLLSRRREKNLIAFGHFFN